MEPPTPAGGAGREKGDRPGRSCDAEHAHNLLIRAGRLLTVYWIAVGGSSITDMPGVQMVFGTGTVPADTLLCTCKARRWPTGGVRDAQDLAVLVQHPRRRPSHGHHSRRSVRSTPCSSNSSG
ncbi:hypothetical protein [Streptacidiphilus sp. MAP5-3]|uniref:hypothetical protein n=1 Tax=unclassified Streptacidiphilus TaxID=2643834 RepID=UPI00351396EF